MSEVSSNRRMPDENQTDERCTTLSNDNPPQATHGSVLPIQIFRRPCALGKKAVFVGKEINGGPCNCSKKKGNSFQVALFLRIKLMQFFCIATVSS